MAAPAWMHERITAEQYDAWSAERCAGIEVVDGMIVVRPSASVRHKRVARIIANALDTAAGPEWNADTGFDVRLQDVPLTNRRPDVVVYRADRIDATPMRPEHAPALGRYREGDVCTGVIKAAAPFPVEVDLRAV